MIHIDLMRDNPAYKLLVGIAWTSLEKIAPYGDTSPVRVALRSQARSLLDLMKEMDLPREDWIEYVANQYRHKALSQDQDLIYDMVKEVFEFDLATTAKHAGLTKDQVNEIALIILSDMLIKMIEEIRAS